MRRRFPLLLKKRGRRRTGSPFWARVGEALYHALFAAAGVIGLWWLFSDVLLPEWRLTEEARSFTETTCRVVGKRVAPRPGLAGDEYCPELRVEYTSAGGESIEVWTRHGVGRDTPSFAEASAPLEEFRIGETRACWYDPADNRRVLLSVNRRWWPWLVVSIPLTLLVAGVVGLVRTLVTSRSTPEQRSAMLASGLEVGALESDRPRPAIASGLPPLDELDDSPGVRRAYRLPADTAPGWRVAGMAILCAVWNVLVALFAYQIGSGYLSSMTRFGLAALVAAPLAIISVRLTMAVWRDAVGAGSAAPTRIEVDRQPIRLGEEVSATLLQFGQGRLRELAATLVCEELATYRQGTDARTAIVEALRLKLLDERRVTPSGDEPLTRELAFRVPADAPHSFASPNNEIRWSLEVTVTPAGRAATVRRFPLIVYPAVGASDAGPVPQTAPGVIA
ncbi:hypothetical protein [Botrimarina sp.]|uniref:DUF3592 domain-containing protein n=1 Tax=Botrimarina sp. TaxID=2795802 RepID=UPI0032EADFEA